MICRRKFSSACFFGLGLFTLLFAYSYYSIVPLSKSIMNAPPSARKSMIIPLGINFTGEMSSSKVERVRLKMKDNSATTFLVTALDEIAWLLNLRGSDVPFSPVFYSYVIITNATVNFFVDNTRITPDVRRHLQQEKLNVTFHPYEDVNSYLRRIVDLNSVSQDKVLLPHGTANNFVKLIPKEKRARVVSPIAIMKTIKNDVEIKGSINAHIKDAVALCSYFAWLEKQVAKNNANVTEISSVKQLQKYRMKQKDFMGLSFAIISGSGPNSAIIHYRPVPETNRPISTNEIYLCDSGAQYKDGTTDVTRTLHFGTPSDFQKECFTRVLKGHIQLRLAKFPYSTSGSLLDIIARKYLWDVGLDYLHATGHGIGAFLNVHEGPIGISNSINLDDPGLQENMLLSNEPAYYEDGNFGIRIENIIRTVPYQAKYSKEPKKFLAFDDLTLVPIQTSKLLIPSLLTHQEIDYINEYHAKCRREVSPSLEAAGELEGLAWLIKETEPIAYTPS